MSSQVVSMLEVRRSGVADAAGRGETEEQRERRFQAEAFPHMRTLYGSAYRMVGNAHDAEDLVQETFLRAYRAFQGFTPGTNIRAWLYTILQRVRTDAFRRRLRSVETSELADDGPGTAPPQDALAHGAEDIERALQALPEVFRQAVVLRDVQEFSYDEIAGMLGVPVGTVMSRIHRGRTLLRKALAHLRPPDGARGPRLEGGRSHTAVAGRQVAVARVS